MGSTYAAGLAEGDDNLMGLRAHLSANFFPPLPGYVQEETVEAIRKHREDGTPVDQKLADACYLKTVEALWRYHGPWLLDWD